MIRVKDNIKNWVPLIRPIHKSSDYTLPELNEYLVKDYCSLMNKTSEFYKTFYPQFYNIFKDLNNKTKFYYFRNNHRIFIYWVIQLSRYFNPNELFDALNDLPFQSVQSQCQLIEDLCQDYDCRSIQKRTLKIYKTKSLKKITKDVDHLKTELVQKAITSKSRPVQLSTPDCQLIFIGSDNMKETKKAVGSASINGYQIIDKLWTPISGSLDKHFYCYVMKKNSNTPIISIN